MKFIHTGDWHIGKNVDGFDMLDDQRHFLKQFIAYAEEVRPDAILIAGDIYDRSVPPAEAVALLGSVLTTLARELAIPTILIAGNHDSSERLGFANSLLGSQGLHIFSSLEQLGTPVVLEDAHGPVEVYGIPFVHPAHARMHYRDDGIRSFEEVFLRAVADIERVSAPEARRICLAHGYIVGAEGLEESESERRLSIGGTDYVDVSVFSSFHYTALGHLHGPQKVARDSIRYAGSPLKYSFSEARQKKSVTLVEMDAEGGTTIEQVSFSPLRDLRVITGRLEELTSRSVYSLADPGDYIKAVLTNEGEVFDAIGTLKKVYPNIMRCEYQARRIRQDQSEELAGRDFRQKAPFELFQEFYGYVEEQALDERQAAIVQQVMEQVKQEVEG